MAKRRNDIPKSLKIMKLVQKIRKQEKVCPFLSKAFLDVASHVTSFTYLVQAK